MIFASPSQGEFSGRFLSIFWAMLGENPKTLKWISILHYICKFIDLIVKKKKQRTKSALKHNIYMEFAY